MNSNDLPESKPQRKTIADYPHLAEQLLPNNPETGEPQNASAIAAHSGRMMWWRCPKNNDHDYPAIPANRMKGRGCPYCAGRKANHTNSLATNKELVAEFHPTKNGNLKPENITPGSEKKVWWKCPVADDHEWEAAPYSRTTNGAGCPCCSGHKVVKSNCLAKIYPDLAAQLLPNQELTAEDIVPGSNKKLWWVCSNDQTHYWEASPNSRTTMQTGCPICAGRRPRALPDQKPE